MWKALLRRCPDQLPHSSLVFFASFCGNSLPVRKRSAPNFGATWFDRCHAQAPNRHFLPTSAPSPTLGLVAVRQHPRTLGFGLPYIPRSALRIPHSIGLTPGAPRPAPLASVRLSKNQRPSSEIQNFKWTLQIPFLPFSLSTINSPTPLQLTDRAMLPIPFVLSRCRA